MAQFNTETGLLDPKISSRYEVMYLANGVSGNVVTLSNPLPVTLGSENITITGNVNFVDTVNVSSSAANPVHVHLTEVGTYGNLTSFVPIQGNVTANGTVNVGNLPLIQTVNGSVFIANTTLSITGNVTANGTINVGNFPSSFDIGNLPATQTVNGSVFLSNSSISVTGNVTANGTVNVGNFPATQTVNGSVNISNATIAVTQSGTWNVTAVATTVNNAPWMVQVSRGLIPGVIPINLFAFNGSITTAFIPVWENATTYSFPASAVNMTVVSTSASDDTNCKVAISGLNSVWAPITEVVTLNGTNAVTTSNEFLRINSMALTQPGTNQLGNVGTITANHTNVIYGQINPTISRSQVSWYSVPAGKTLYVSRVNAFSGDAAGASKYTETRVDVKNNVTGVNYILVQLGWTNYYEVVRDNYQPYTEKTDVRWEARMSQGTYSCSFVVQGILIDN